jgi:hypothetical protein
MRTLHPSFTRGAAVLAAGAALAAVGCAPRDTAQAAQLTSASTAMSVACEPTQRAVVHPAVVNGVAMSQVECVSTAAPANGAANSVETVSYEQQPAVQPAVIPAPVVSYQPQPVYNTPRVIPATYTPPAPARVSNEPVQRYERRPAKRSVKKSAVIIGASAGAGAGLGAVLGGKKGAAIGAIVGGGGATLWDQITRRR